MAGFCFGLGFHPYSTVMVVIRNRIKNIPIKVGRVASSLLF